MKQPQKLAVTFVCLTSVASALAEPQLSDLYTQAKNAYKSGDCSSAIELFNKYKTENEGELKAHVEFSQKIDDAINDCQKKSVLINYDRQLITKNTSDVIDDTVARIQAAIDEINKGANNEAVVALIKKASDFSNEINANDKVSRENSKVRQHLKAAIAAAKSENLEESNAKLKEAKEELQTLKGHL
jgi:hypothetical protein